MNLPLIPFEFWLSLAATSVLVLGCGVLVGSLLKSSHPNLKVLWAVGVCLLSFLPIVTYWIVPNRIKLPISPNVSSASLSAPEPVRGPESMQQSVKPNGSSVTPSKPGERPAQPLDWRLISLAIWGLGSACHLVWFVGQFWALKRQIVGKRFMNMHDRWSVSEVSSIKQPMVSLFPLEILVPPGFDADSLDGRAALEHEAAHIKLNHGLGLIITNLTVAAYWWSPFSWMMSRFFTAAAEDAADFVTVQRMGSPKPLVVAIQKFASLKPENTWSGLAMTSRTPNAVLRVKSLLSDHSQMKTLKTPHVLATLGVGLLLAAVPITFAKAQVQSYTDGGFFGLKLGNKWTYRLTASTQEPVTYTTIASNSSPFSTFNVIELRTKHERYTSFAYSAQFGGMLYHFLNSQMSGPGFERVKPTHFAARSNASKGQSWTWKEAFRGQTSGEGPVDMEALASMATATVIATDEQVTVPAGTYTTLHIQTKRTSSGLGDSTTDTWYANGIGKVKEVVVAKDWSSTQELTKFEEGDGKPIPPTQNELRYP